MRTSIYWIVGPWPGRLAIVPRPPASFEKMEECVRKVEGSLVQGRNVAVHCRQGIGRSALLAAGTLVLGGIEPVEAFARIEAGRGCSVPDTPVQHEWVVRFAKKLGPVAKA